MCLIHPKPYPLFVGASSSGHLKSVFGVLYMFDSPFNSYYFVTLYLQLNL